MAFVSLTSTPSNLRIGIWEDEAHTATPLEGVELPKEEWAYLRTITHIHKRRQSYQARLCLHHLLADFPPFFITHTSKQAPCLCPRLGCISLAHTQGMSAVIFSDMYQVGIDVESLKRPYAPETTAYFMSPPERNLYYETPQRERPFIYFLTWCAKEALYKLFSPWASLSFRDHIILLPATLTSRTIQAKALLRNRVFLLNIEYFQRNDFLICYVFSVLHPDYID